MPLPFDSFTLAAVCAELQSLLPESVLEAALQPAPDELVLRLFKNGAARYLLLSCAAQTARVHLTVVRRPATPTPVPALCAAVRKALEGATLTAISLPFGFGERTLALSFTTPQDTQYVLYAETQGTRSNLVLVGPDGRVIDAARRVGKSVNRVRQTLPGLPYAAPPPQTRADGSPRLDPFAPFVPGADAPLSASAARAFLLDTWAGISPLLAREVMLRATNTASLTPVALHGFLLSMLTPLQTGRFLPHLWTDERGHAQGAYAVPLLSVPANLQHLRESLSLALDNAAASLETHARLEEARAGLLSAIDRSTKRREREREELADALQNAARAEEWQQAGDLLLASPQAFTAGRDTVTVSDWYGPLDGSGSVPTRTLSVDPALTWKDNAERFFARARKARAALSTLAARRDAAMDELLRLSAAREQSQTALNLDGIKIAREKVTGLLAKEHGPTAGAARAENPFGGHHIRAFASPDGWDIWVGEDAAANDFLTGKLARPSDIWLHARQAASAHAIVRVPRKGEAPPLPTLLRAAELVAARSAVKHSALVPVDYTLKKFVRKPRGSAPGAALYSREKTLHVPGIHG